MTNTRQKNYDKALSAAREIKIEVDYRTAKRTTPLTEPEFAEIIAKYFPGRDEKKKEE
jgi:hypothetical protein